MNYQRQSGHKYEENKMFFFKKSKILMPYVIRNEKNGEIIGISEDATEEAKEAFKEYMEIQESAKKDGCRL